VPLVRRRQLPGLGHALRLGQDLGMLHPPLIRQHWQEAGDARITGGTKRERCEGMWSPAKRIGHAAEPADSSSEGTIQGRPTNRVINQIYIIV
jgi:hypothetical protein